ncbi:unnamed protein product, partial [Musa textilis]
MAAARDSMGFQDFLPRMAERLGAEGLMEELCKGFKLLMDPARGVITSESLRRNVAALGLAGAGRRRADGHGEGGGPQRGRRVGPAGVLRAHGQIESGAHRRLSPRRLHLPCSVAAST